MMFFPFWLRRRNWIKILFILAHKTIHALDARADSFGSREADMHSYCPLVLIILLIASTGSSNGQVEETQESQDAPAASGMGNALKQSGAKVIDAVKAAGKKVEKLAIDHSTWATIVIFVLLLVIQCIAMYWLLIKDSPYDVTRIPGLTSPQEIPDSVVVTSASVPTVVQVDSQPFIMPANQEGVVVQQVPMVTQVPTPVQVMTTVGESIPVPTPPSFSHVTKKRSVTTIHANTTPVRTRIVSPPTRMTASRIVTFPPAPPVVLPTATTTAIVQEAQPVLIKHVKSKEKVARRKSNPKKGKSREPGKGKAVTVTTTEYVSPAPVQRIVKVKSIMSPALVPGRTVALPHVREKRTSVSPVVAVVPVTTAQQPQGQQVIVLPPKSL